jgi:anti-sigma B factor antagonist
MLKFRRSERAGRVVLHLEGALDAVSAPDIRPTIEQLVGQRPARITVDVSQLRLIDSSGVGALVSLYKRVRANGGQVEIAGLREQPLAIFKLLGLDQLLGPMAADP